jgi:hypothetical protein
MTMTTEFENHPQGALLEKLEVRVNSAVSRVAERGLAMDRHEEHLSSRLAQAIQDELEHFPITVEGVRVDVFVEEFTKVEESRCGADLYISIVRRDVDEPFGKGMLVQSKHKEALRKAEERRRLRNQSGRMRRRAPDDSYVWVFDDGSVQAAPAPKSSNPKLRDLPYNHQSVGHQIAAGVACEQGSYDIGINTEIDDDREALRDAMRRISAPSGMSLVVRNDPYIA